MAEDYLQEEDPFHPTINWALWRKILVFARPYRGWLAALSALGIVCACCDLTLPLLTGRIINEIQARGAEARIMPYALVYVGIVAVLSACIYGFIVVAGIIATGVSYDIRETSFAKLQELPFSFYDRKAVGWLMARLTSDCSSLSRIMGWALLDIAWGTFALVAITITMFVLDWRLALIVLLIVPPLLVASRFFQVRILINSRLLRKSNSITTAAFNEGIVGVRTSKSLVREERNLHEFSALIDTMYQHAVRTALYSALFLPVVVSICAIGTGLALWRGGIDVATGTLSLGLLVTFLQYAAWILNPVQELANTLTMIQGAQASAERIQGLLDTDPDIKDSPEVLARVARHIGAATPSPLEGEGRGEGERPVNPEARLPGHHALAPDGLPSHIETIEFRNVTFAYKEGQTVLRNFNLKVHAGQSIALVGPTGGGKTTIVGLVCRFYEPTEGQILVNGIDYRERPLRWLQSQLGMVLQQPHLFSGNVRENIRYGRLSATDEEIEAAAKVTNAHEFIAAMKDGYNTQVGEGGNQLSTGQKQLIALTRAILADPQIFVMDEATSSVDTQTERAIQAAIDRVLENRISFVIAHRLSTIRSADRILVIGNGQIVEEGDHHELIRRRGKYFELYTNQFTHEREDQMLDYATAVEE